MCKKLKEIHGMQSEDIIKAFVPDRKITTMKDLLNKMNIKCMDVDFSSLEKRMHMKNHNFILCISYCDDANLKILYSHDLDKERLDYILAHELAYCCLHFPVSAEYHITTKSESDLCTQSNFLYAKKLKIFLNEEETYNFAATLLENLRSSLTYSTKRFINPAIYEKENIIKIINNKINLQLNRNYIVKFLDSHKKSISIQTLMLMN